MSNHCAYHKAIDHVSLIAELQKAGVTLGINIDHCNVYLTGATNPEELSSQLELVEDVLARYNPSTVTEVTLNKAPHTKALLKQASELDSITSVSVELPHKFPGRAIFRHNSLTNRQKNLLSNTAKAHLASEVPYLSVIPEKLTIPITESGALTLKDSRGAYAYNKTASLWISPSGSGGISSDTFVINSKGEATIEFLPTNALTGDLTFVVYYSNDEADSATFVIRRGTP